MQAALILQRLHKAIAAVAPINGVSGRDASSWSIDFNNATDAQKQAAFGVLASFDPNAPDYRALADAALLKSDMVGLRCFKSGTPFPSDWQNYTAQLRAIVNSGAGPLPAQPPFPLGT